MRVIGGEHRGKRLLKAVADTRPTTDRAREALFNALGGLVLGARWMEPFAGSGAVGIEALSRGASHVVLNDRSEAAVELVRKNLANCGVGNGFELHCRDAFSFLGQLRGDSFDVVFLDPPYGFRRYPKLLNKLYDSLADLDRTVVILEIFKKTSLDFIQNPWHRIRTLEVGDTHFLFLGCCAAS